jgi:hypothetical protein
MKATLLWARGSRYWAINRLERLRNAAPTFQIRGGNKVNVTEEEIAITEARLAKAEELIRKCEKANAKSRAS